MNKLLAVVAVIGLAASFAAAADAPTVYDQVGNILKVEGVNVVLKFQTNDSKGNPVVLVRTYVTNDKTVITVDGKASKLADLKVGLFTVVTYTEAPAAAPNTEPTRTSSKIVATTTEPPAPGP